jgi:tRNA pseudouridine38-40 synthase
MARFKFLIEYDGGAFVGWQIQAEGVSVQGILQEALGELGETTLVYGAGRTDAGVHALGQVAHADLVREWDPVVLGKAINFHVRPHKVSVLGVERAPAEFHARFDAVARRYLYRILNRRSPPALERGKVWWIPLPLNPDAMHESAQLLLGKHDFTTFRSAACQAKSAIKTLDRLDVSRRGEEIEIVAEARSFLHHQVRSMVGSLRLVGEGKWTPDDLARALEARDRAACGAVAPPQGLYLVGVAYPGAALK